MSEDTKIYNGHIYKGEMLEACLNGYKQGKSDERKHLINIAIETRNHAVDDCIQLYIDFCGGMPNTKLVNAMKKMKE